MRIVAITHSGDRQLRKRLRIRSIDLGRQKVLPKRLEILLFFYAELERSVYGSGVILVQDVRIDPGERRVWRGEQEIGLSRKEFDLLHYLAVRAGEVVSREELMRDVWDTSFWTSSKTIDVHLGWLRRKLGDHPRRPTLITTHRGLGLQMEKAPPLASQAPG